jgi:hypothetical protein
MLKKVDRLLTNFDFRSFKQLPNLENYVIFFELLLVELRLGKGCQNIKAVL